MTIKSDQHGAWVQAARPYQSQNVTVGAASVQSLAFSVATSPAGSYAGGPVAGVPISTPNQTLHVRLVASSDCYVLFGTNPTVSVSIGMFIPASTPEYFWVLPGDKVAVIQSSAAGVLNVTECVA